MKKVIVTHFLLSLFFVVNAQENCPQGYEQREVKCSGKIVSKCVPVNYTCNKCWSIEWQKCDGNWGGGLMGHSTYEKCLEDAQKTISGTLFHECPEIMNKYKYRIYLDDSKFCSTTPNSNAALIADLKNKIISFLQRYRAEISNFKRYYSGQSYKPGATFKEYESTIKQAEENANNLETVLNNINDNNLAQVEKTMSDMQIEETNFKQKEVSIKNKISTEKQEETNKKNLEQQKSNDSKNNSDNKKTESNHSTINKAIDNPEIVKEKAKKNYLPADDGEKDDDVDYAKSKILEIEAEKDANYKKMDSLMHEFRIQEEYVSQHLAKENTQYFLDAQNDVSEISNKLYAVIDEYSHVHRLCKSQIRNNEPVSLNYLQMLNWSINDDEGSLIYNTTKIKDLVDLNTKVIDGVLNLIAAAPKREAFDPSSGGENGNHWLGIGGMQPVNNDMSLNKTGLTAKYLTPIWGNHFQFVFEAMYTYYLESDKKIAEQKLNFPSNSITSFKPDGEISLNLGWGPYLIKRQHSFLVIQPTAGFKSALGYTAKTNHPLTSSAVDNGKYEFSVGKDADKDIYFLFQYGGFIRYYSENFLFSVGYMTHSPYNLYFKNTFFNQKVTLDLTQISFSIQYRLL